MERRTFQRFGARFEELCAQLLEELDYKVERNVRSKEGIEVDIVAYGKTGAPYVIEVKALLARQATLSVLRDVVVRARLQIRISAVPRSRPLLIISAEVDPEHRQWLEAEFRLELWDRRHVKEHARSTNLRGHFDELFEQLDGESKATLAPPTESSQAAHTSVTDAPEDRARHGVDFCAELRRLKPGRTTAKAYEKLMERILEYLFGEYLLDPQPQRRQEDSLSILDITYRIRPSHPFWDTLTRDFRARVIIFEFKNYKHPIRSMQIYTTERYIHVGALRPVCFVISRKSPHKHALKAALGAMRESTKLMVLLSDDDICKMLDLRDAQLRISSSDNEYFQNDPTIVLDQKIYQFLSTMPR